MNFLFYKCDPRLLGIIRIALGTWFFVDIVSLLISGYVQRAYIDAKINFPFLGFEWIEPMPAFGMYALFSILLISTIFIIIGFRSKIALLIFVAGFSYVFLLDVVYTLNKFYLLLLLSSYMIFLPVDRVLSIRVKKSPTDRLLFIPYWMILLFQVQIGIIYFFSGIAKINPHWIFDSQPLLTFFSYRWPFTELGDEGLILVAKIFSFSGLVFDLSIIFLLWNKRTRFFGQLWQTAFHSLNLIILHIGSLSIFMCLLTWVLFPTPWLQRKLKYYGVRNREIGRRNSVVPAVLIMILLIHLVIPLRHLVSGNDVNWTEKGHRFSWRLMTRTKGGSNARFTIIDNKTEEKWDINPKVYLTSRQYRKMAGETDLVIYFAHYLQEEWSRKGYDDVRIYGSIMTRMNSMPPDHLISPDLDLTKVKRSFLMDSISLPPPKFPTLF